MPASGACSTNSSMPAARMASSRGEYSHRSVKDIVVIDSRNISQHFVSGGTVESAIAVRPIRRQLNRKIILTRAQIILLIGGAEFDIAAQTHAPAGFALRDYMEATGSMLPSPESVWVAWVVGRELGRGMPCPPPDATTLPLPSTKTYGTVRVIM